MVELRSSNPDHGRLCDLFKAGTNRGITGAQDFVEPVFNAITAVEAKRCRQKAGLSWQADLIFMFSMPNV